MTQPQISSILRLEYREEITGVSCFFGMHSVDGAAWVPSFLFDAKCSDIWRSPTPGKELYEDLIDSIRWFADTEFDHSFFNDTAERLRQMALDVIQGRAPVPDDSVLFVRYDNGTQQKFRGGEFVPSGATHVRAGEGEPWVAVEEYQPVISQQTTQS